MDSGKITETEDTVTEMWRFMGPPEKEADAGEQAQEWHKMKGCASFETKSCASKMKAKKAMRQKPNKKTSVPMKKVSKMKAVKAMRQKRNKNKSAMKKKG